MYLLSKKIKTETNIRTILSGGVIDDIFEGTIEEKINKIKNIHKYNLLGMNKATISNLLELRLPFTDREFIDNLMDINPQKNLLKNIFNEEFLTLNLELNKNENIKEILINYSNENISDGEFNNKDQIFPINTPEIKEAFLYRKLFEKFYSSNCCIKIIDNYI